MGHSFKDGHAEAFVETREGEDGCFLVEAAEFVVGDVTEEFDAWVRFGGGEHRFRFEAQTAGNPEFPWRRHSGEGLNQARGVLAFLHGAYAKDDRFTRFDAGDLRLWMNAVRNDVDAAGGVVQVFNDLVSRELADCDDVSGMGCGVASLFLEATAKFGRRVFRAQDEEVMEGGDAGDLGSFGQALVEAVEEVAGAGSRFKEEAFGPGRAKEAMGSIV